MKEIIFNEGGQPVFLDDLETLQGNCLELITQIFLGLTERSYGAYFLAEPVVSGDNIFLGRSRYVIVEGKLIKITGDVTSGKIPELNLHVYTEDVDDRILRNGMTKPCGKNHVAVLTTEKTVNVGRLYPVSSIVSFANLIRRNVIVEETLDFDGKWVNGYHGTIRCQSIGRVKRYIVNIVSEQKSWSVKSPTTLEIIPMILQEPFDGSLSCPTFKLGDNYATIYQKANGLYLDIIGGELSQELPPADCPINVVFDIVE